LSIGLESDGALPFHFASNLFLLLRELEMLLAEKARTNRGPSVDVRIGAPRTA